ncbi:transposable element Tc1 transposase [Trichonephila clavipes]|nr:transposable element Tc1 transposase [Trichonephila clavipes]
MMDDPKIITRRGALQFFSRRETITGERPTSFPKKIQPCLTRDSNPNPLGYKPRVIATILAGRRRQLVMNQNNENLAGKVKHGNGDFLVWGCKSASGLGNLAFFDDIVNHELYINILKNNLKIIHSKLGFLRRLHFQQDNDAKDTTLNKLVVQIVIQLETLNDVPYGLVQIPEKNIRKIHWDAHSCDTEYNRILSLTLQYSFHHEAHDDNLLRPARHYDVAPLLIFGCHAHGGPHGRRRGKRSVRDTRSWNYR